MWLAVIIFLISILVPGWLILALWFDQETKGWFKKTALAYGLGTALLTTEIFLIVFIFRLPVKWLYSVLAVEILAGGWCYWRRCGFDFLKRLKRESGKITWMEICLTLLVAWQVATISLLAWLNSAMNWDGVAMWSVKAKALFYYPQAFFAPGNQWFWQQHNFPIYPWLIPLTQYWLAVVNKSFDDVAINFIFVGFFLAIIFLLYGYLRNYLSRWLSLLVVFFFSTLPLVAYHAYNNYADLPLAFYLGVAFVLHYKWLETSNNKYLSLSWLFLASAFFTKNEAIIFIIAQLLILLIAKNSFKIRWQKIFWAMVPGLILIMPWLGFRLVNKLSLRNVASGIHWHGPVIAKFVEDMFVDASWNIWWYIFFGLSLLFVKQIIKNRSLALAYGWWCLSLGGFLILYLFTEEYQWAMDGTAVSRNLINFIPGSVFLLGLLLRREFFESQKFFKK